VKQATECGGHSGPAGGACCALHGKVMNAGLFSPAFMNETG
jgi:hypothetical protein